MQETRARATSGKVEIPAACPDECRPEGGNGTQPTAPHDLHILLMERADLLHRYVRSKIPDRLRQSVSADDVLQEVWFAAFRAYPSFKSSGPDSFDRWLMRITERRMLNVFRNARRVKRGGNALHANDLRAKATSYLDLCARAVGKERTPSSEDAAREAVHAVQIALGELPERYRTAIIMHHIEGRPRDDVARAMGTTSPAVNSLLFRGLSRLRDQLGSPGRYFSDVPQSQE